MTLLSIPKRLHNRLHEVFDFRNYKTLLIKICRFDRTLYAWFDLILRIFVQGALLTPVVASRNTYLNLRLVFCMVVASFCFKVIIEGYAAQ